MAIIFTWASSWVGLGIDGLFSPLFIRKKRLWGEDHLKVYIGKVSKWYSGKEDIYRSKIDDKIRKERHEQPQKQAAGEFTHFEFCL